MTKSKQESKENSKKGYLVFLVEFRSYPKSSTFGLDWRRNESLGIRVPNAPIL